MFHSNDGRRVAVITGASKGFGKSIAEFAKAGYCVLMNSLNEKELKIAANDISNIIGDSDRSIILQAIFRKRILVNHYWIML